MIIQLTRTKMICLNYKCKFNKPQENSCSANERDAVQISGDGICLTQYAIKEAIDKETKMETLKDKVFDCVGDCEEPNVIREEDVKDKVKELKATMDLEIDFAEDANVPPSIHPKIVKGWIDKIFGVWE